MTPVTPVAEARVARWRAETPGADERAHLNNAGAALQPRAVLDAVTAHLAREAVIGGYEAADEAAERVHAAYEAVAGLVGAAAHNIAVVENATAAFAQALAAFDFRPGDVIVTSRADYPSNQLMYLSLARRAGVATIRAHDLPEGGVDPAHVRQLVRHPRCRLVALTWVPTNSGLIQAVHDVGEVCEDAGISYLVDACQAVGQLPVDTDRLRCDFLTATARKFLRGPRGVGFLYVADRALARGVHPLLVDLRGADWIEADDFRLANGARRFENWEFAYALVLGMGEAARYAMDAGSDGFTRAHQLAARLRERLAAVDGVRVLDRGRALSAIVSAEVRGWDADRLKLRLRKQGINTSAVTRKAGVIDMDDKGVATALRLSPHYYNTLAEVDRAVAAVADALEAP